MSNREAHNASRAVNTGLDGERSTGGGGGRGVRAPSWRMTSGHLERPELSTPGCWGAGVAGGETAPRWSGTQSGLDASPPLQAKDMFIPNPAGEPPQMDSDVDLLGWGAGGRHEAALLDQQPEDAYNPMLRVSPPDIPDQP